MTPDANELPLDIYIDLETPGVPDWTAIQRPSLEAAKAMLFVASPGALTCLGPDDWVHQELDWWLTHREAPPIVVETTGDGARWIPKKLIKRWPNLNRLEFLLDRYRALPENQQALERKRLLSLICSSIYEIAPRIEFQQVHRLRSLQRSAKFLVGTCALLLIVISVLTLEVKPLYKQRDVLGQQNAALASAQTSLQAIVRQSSKEAELLSKEVEDLALKFDKPPLFILSEDEAATFQAGSAILNPEFRERLNKIVIGKIETIASKSVVTELQIIAHTDSDPMPRRLSNLDVSLRSGLSGADLSRIIPGSNVELGLLRALAVASAFREAQANGALKSIKHIQVLTAGSLDPIETEASSPRAMRRIEIRLLQ